MESRISRAVTTLVQMLGDRGEPAPHLQSLSQAHMDELVRGCANGIIRLDTGTRDVIIFTLKAKSSDISKAASETTDERLRDAILITQEPLKKTQSASASAAFGVWHESFTLADLSINISRHVLVPKHEIVPVSEVASVKEHTVVSELTQLPLIRRDDAMAKYIRARSGDVVKITRICPTAGHQTAYRYCR